jgi:hypothetical protein
MTERGSARGFWLWVGGGVVVCIGTVVLLDQWFRLASGAVAGWGVFAMGSLQQRRRLDLRSSGIWASSVGMLLLVVGLSLLLGAVGLSSDERTDSPVPGAVLGGVLVAAGALGLFLAWRRQRRVAVDAEVERYRAAERTPDASA